MNDLPYATGRMIFDNDFESLFSGKTCCIPDVMYDKMMSKKSSFHGIYNRQQGTAAIIQQNLVFTDNFV